MIIDFHIHIHPFPTSKNGLKMPADYEDENRWRLERCGIDVDRQAEIAVQRMDAAGVDVAVVQNPYHGLESGHIRSNKTVYRAISPYEGRLYAFAGVYIWPRPDLAELEYAIGALGFKGLKILPASQSFHVNNWWLLDGLYRKLIEFDVPLLVHAGPTHFPGSDPSVCDLAEYREVADRYPDLKLVLAHLGSGAKGGKEAAIGLAAEFPNVFVEASTWFWQCARPFMPPDTKQRRAFFDNFVEEMLYPESGTRAPEMEEAWQRGKEEHSKLLRSIVAAAPGKLMYATDLPFIAKFDFADLFKEAFADDPVTAEAVLGGTARRLLKL